jgi:ribonuclease VapC
MKIVADASAILAILFDEPDSKICLAKLLSASDVMISPVNWWEVQVRMRSKYGEAGETMAEDWMTRNGIMIESITAEQARIAVSASVNFKGRPARLNLGDCFAYALARAKKAPLLYKGEDFVHTDVEPA